jgi:beta-mannanase
MNGNWYPWCGTVNDNRPQEFILAWKHLYGLFARERLDHVKWVWSPYALSVPTTAANEMECYYPGDEYVDWIGLDGYNWGDTREWSRWQTFESVFGCAYRAVTRMSAKPIMIPEMGCAESGGSKATWIRDAVLSIREAYPRLGAVTWFNVNKECDWRVESSDESLSSFRENWRSKSKRGGCDAL